MSWKAVELQVALPRTQDAGKLQEQLQQRGQVAQDRLAAEHEKKHDKARTQVTDKDAADKNKFNNQNGNIEKRENFVATSKDNASQDEKTAVHHPYKGKSIDITG
ncbi:hypothetical protein D7Z54_11215 [Salibacterium salarium]|uniref:Uncharacterized protein n=1 Tax=Salibacterium salarium TaxID=284579 RepID=A0A3R9RDQ8_9BACI|nr:hypothetical protein [Salibacterium salarium]RSL33192.1 hypothetical protein D7Z54_11215 [Salibacterium salarium]